MLPVVVFNPLQAIELLASGSRTFAEMRCRLEAT